MDITLFQFSFWLAIALVFLYTLGQHWQTSYREIMQAIGLAGAGLIIVWWFFGACPALAVTMVIRLLIATLIIKFFVWLFFKIHYDENPTRSDKKKTFNPTLDKSHSENRAYEQAVQTAIKNRSGRRPAGFEQTDRERQASLDQNLSPR